MAALLRLRLRLQTSGVGPITVTNYTKGLREDVITGIVTGTKPMLMLPNAVGVKCLIIFQKFPLTVRFSYFQFFWCHLLFLLFAATDIGLLNPGLYTSLIHKHLSSHLKPFH